MDDRGGGVLDDVRVLDLSGLIGAYCTHLLADLGADVALVEPPAGDRLRRVPPFADDDPRAALLFAYYHASKRSVVLDPAGDLLRRLGPGVDVVVVSPSPGTPTPGWDPVARRLAWAPHAIVCAITPFGLTGPHASWRATPMTSFAMGGNMVRIGPPEGPPVTAPGRQCWDEAGAHAAIAILAALAVVDDVGAQCIDISVHEVAATKDFLIEQYDAVEMSVHGRSVAVGYPPTGTFVCADGPFDVAAHQPWHWDAFLDMLDRPAELSDPSLTDALVRRERHDELREAIAALVRDRSREDLVERGQSAGLPCGMLHRPTEFVRDRQLVARATFVETPTPTGPMPMPGPGSGFRSTPPLTRPRTSAPSAVGADAVAWDPRARRRAGDDRRVRAPLSGTKVLSFGAFIAGNTTASILGQLGADVVKLESRSRPEVLRAPAYAYGPTAREPSGVTNTVMYVSLSRSARNVSVDVASPAGRDVLRRLVAVADIVVENFGSGVLTEWGLSFDQLREINPRIVLTSLSGYGRTGPRASYLAYASNISNFAGLTYAWGFGHGTLSDYVTAAHAVFGTLAALRQVARVGTAVWVDAAQIEAMAATMPDSVLEALANSRDLPAPGNEVAGSLLSGVYRCVGHDAWVAVELEDPADSARACELLDLPISASSEADARGSRQVLEAALHGWAAERTAHSAARELQQAGVAAGVVQSSEDLWRDPQLWSRDFPVLMGQPDVGPLHYAQSVYRLGLTPGRIGDVGHRLGADTAAVLAEWLGCAPDDVRALADSGVVFQC